MGRMELGIELRSDPIQHHIIFRPHRQVLRVSIEPR